MPQTRQQISAAGGPKFTILQGHVGEILLFNKFFPIIDTCLSCEDVTQLEMRANAQHDGRPAAYRWRRLFNAAKFG